MADTSIIQSNSIKLRPVENGFVLSWECQYRMGRGTYDGMTNYATEEEVFKASEGSKALARMLEIYKMSGEEMVDDGDEA